jgi:hypothetical protein
MKSKLKDVFAEQIVELQADRDRVANLAEALGRALTKIADKANKLEARLDDVDQRVEDLEDDDWGSPLKQYPPLFDVHVGEIGKLHVMDVGQLHQTLSGVFGD